MNRRKSGDGAAFWLQEAARRRMPRAEPAASAARGADVVPEHSGERGTGEGGVLDVTTAGSRIDAINTEWTLFRLAHQSSVTRSGEFRERLVLRYAEAIRAYVGALVASPHDADELAQEALLRLLQGDFAGATPERGSFRALLKTALRNMVRNRLRADARLRARHRQAALSEGASHIPADWDRCWDEEWMRVVLERVWEALDHWERHTPGALDFTLLSLRKSHPDATIAELAAALREKTGREFSDAGLRQRLRRARCRFAQLLFDEVARGLDNPKPADVHDELAEVGLLHWVRDFLPAEGLAAVWTSSRGDCGCGEDRPEEASPPHRQRSAAVT